MSKIDIRFRRQQFTQGRIQQHKNYDSLMERHRRSHRRKIRGVVLIAFVLILIIIISISFFHNANAKPIQKNLPNLEVHISGSQSVNFE